MADPIVVNATGTRIEHYGQHGPDCFGCKLKTIRFGALSAPTHSPNSDKRWESDPVKQRIEEIHGIKIDTDHLNRRRVDLQKEQ